MKLPLSSFGLGGGDGEGQMKHFAQDNMMNMFRLRKAYLILKLISCPKILTSPAVSWQFLVDNQLGGPLNEANVAQYDRLVQSCLATGAHCLLEIHNFARWDGQVIGQSGPGGPTDDDFASLWAQLAARYASTDRVAFELMNEPHDLDVALWAATCQKAVTAIRNAAPATQHMILLPGTQFASAAALVASGSGGALAAVTNPDGSTANLLLAIHTYLDQGNSGTQAECVTNNTGVFGEVAQFLRRVGRQAIITETGAAAGGGVGCLMRFCEQNTFINANADVFAGLISWGAGSLGADYLLSQTPALEGGRLIDSPLLAQCVVGTWMMAGGIAQGKLTTFSHLAAVEGANFHVCSVG